MRPPRRPRARSSTGTRRRAGDALDQCAVPRSAPDERAADLQLSPGALLGKLRLHGRALLHLDRRAAEIPRSGEPTGVTRIGDFSFDTTGVLGVSYDADGRSRRGARSRVWLTLPGEPSLALARDWHFAMAWLFVAQRRRLSAVRSAQSGHFRRDLAPTAEQLAPAPHPCGHLGPYPAAAAARRGGAALQRAAEVRLSGGDLRAAAGDGAQRPHHVAGGHRRGAVPVRPVRRAAVGAHDPLPGGEPAGAVRARPCGRRSCSRALSTGCAR